MMAVVMVPVWLCPPMERLPPTIITAPTSLMAAPNPATIAGDEGDPRLAEDQPDGLPARSAQPHGLQAHIRGHRATPPMVMAAITGAAMKNSAMIIAVGV